MTAQGHSATCKETALTITSNLVSSSDCSVQAFPCYQFPVSVPVPVPVSLHARRSRRSSQDAQAQSRPFSLKFNRDRRYQCYMASFLMEEVAGITVTRQLSGSPPLLHLIMNW